MPKGQGQEAVLIVDIKLGSFNTTDILGVFSRDLQKYTLCERYREQIKPLCNELRKYCKSAAYYGGQGKETKIKTMNVTGDIKKKKNLEYYIVQQVTPVI